MPSKRMLVDATHPEETRVVVTNGNRLEEFDFESASRRQLRGNIYLAKVTRVEPSLQAAFVDYGGNRHGFLAFSEIHPDYYQIPLADREALLRAQAEDNAQAAEADDIAAHGIPGENNKFDQPAETEESKPVDVHDHEEADSLESSESGEPSGEAAADAAPVESVAEPVAPKYAEKVDEVGGDETISPPRRQRSHRRARVYKIQEVIKRRQVLLVQVVKEERGTKGAALTTYLSLAGRYSVLMPNTARGGGISRKITSAADRKRLKEIVEELNVPTDMGVILRTAGASRNKAEVKRDFEYLLRLWENVRELTLASTAPTLVYEEGSLIKRAIRDLYSKDITEVVISGDEAYKESKEFMKMIMPSHARHVKLYKEDQPVFSRYNVEPQLDAMFSPRVTLPSGGYLVINPTEALVSIDVNSGKSTREHSIEETALQTNLEAADEVARQLRLRDLAGLIVVDFIDMEEKRNNRTVERRLKDALKDDRARIQIGRISHFGLMEMSRQRIRFGVLESSTRACPHCEGTGLVRSTESLSLAVMRALEDHVRRRPGQSVTVRVPTEVALYVLNAKRASLADLEMKHRLSIAISADAQLGPNQYAIERRDTGPVQNGGPAHVRVDSAPMDSPPADLPVDESEPAPVEEIVETAESTEPREHTHRHEHPRHENGNDGQRRGRRRRGRRGGRRNRHEGEHQQQFGNGQPSFAQDGAEPQADNAEPQPERQEGEAQADPAPQRFDRNGEQSGEGRRGRRRRGRRRHGNGNDNGNANGNSNRDQQPREYQPANFNAPQPTWDDEIDTTPQPEPRPARQEASAPASIPEPRAAESEPQPRHPGRALPPEGEIVVTTTAGDVKPKRFGWWKRG